jgi:hypothetical protein
VRPAPVPTPQRPAPRDQSKSAKRNRIDPGNQTVCAPVAADACGSPAPEACNPRAGHTGESNHAKAGSRFPRRWILRFMLFSCSQKSRMTAGARAPAAVKWIGLGRRRRTPQARQCGSCANCDAAAFQKSRLTISKATWPRDRLSAPCGSTSPRPEMAPFGVDQFGRTNRCGPPRALRTWYGECLLVNRPSGLQHDRDKLGRQITRQGVAISAALVQSIYG